VWCLMPACVRVEAAWAVVGVLAPEPEGVIAMGAIVSCAFFFLLVDVVNVCVVTSRCGEVKTL
jgi:hypothetical protein